MRYGLQILIFHISELRTFFDQDFTFEKNENPSKSEVKNLCII